MDMLKPLKAQAQAQEPPIPNREKTIPNQPVDFSQAHSTNHEAAATTYTKHS
jgi:hypothetical protein